ncbi:MAG: cyclodeaminase/cyclohydrolase family protein [Clostridia bacterium]
MNASDFSSLKITDFLDILSTKAPVPGGGGASALVGAVASALASMVANLTTGKKKYAEYEPDIQRIIGEAKLESDKLIDLIQADADAFYPLSQAYGLDKNADNRDFELQRTLRAAIDPPLLIMQEITRVIALHDELLKKGSKIALSDVGVGAIMCKSALLGASLNVFINTKLLTDRTFAEETNKYANELIDKYGKMADEIFDRVKKELN